VAYLAGAGEAGGRRPLPFFMLLDLKLPKRSGHEVLQWSASSPACGGSRWSS
jgi:hypothetical protein